MQFKFNEFETLQKTNSSTRFGDILSIDLTSRKVGSGLKAKDQDELVMKVDPNLFIQWGESYVLSTVNGLIVRRLLPGTTLEKITCVSCNEAVYPSFEVDKDNIHGFYKILKSEED